MHSLNVPSRWIVFSWPNELGKNELKYAVLGMIEALVSIFGLKRSYESDSLWWLMLPAAAFILHILIGYFVLMYRQIQIDDGEECLD